MANRQLTIPLPHWPSECRPAAQPFVKIATEGLETASSQPAVRPTTASSRRTGRLGARSRVRGDSGQPDDGVSGAPKDIATIGDLTPDQRNANKGTERGRGMLEQSLRQDGPGRSILVDRDGNVIAGNKTLEAAADLGLPIRVVQTDGQELVVVQRRDLDLTKDTAARRLAYADNRVAEVDLAWDVAQLRADIDAAVDLGAIFEPVELADLLGADMPVPEFTEASEAEQGRLDQLQPFTCPHCGGAIRREDLS